MIASEEAKEIQDLVDKFEKEVLKKYFDYGYCLIAYKSIPHNKKAASVTSRIDGQPVMLFNCLKIIREELGQLKDLDKIEVLNEEIKH